MSPLLRFSHAPLRVLVVLLLYAYHDSVSRRIIVLSCAHSCPHSLVIFSAILVVHISMNEARPCFKLSLNFTCLLACADIRFSDVFKHSSNMFRVDLKITTCINVALHRCLSILVPTSACLIRSFRPAENGCKIKR